MKSEILTLRIDSAEVVEAIKNTAVVAGYEVTLPGGNVLLYGLLDASVVMAFVEMLGQDAVEPLYKFGKNKPDANQPELF